jgi:hypothetical protein
VSPSSPPPCPAKVPSEGSCLDHLGVGAAGHAEGVELRVSTLGPDLALQGAHALVLSGALGLVGFDRTDGTAGAVAAG